MIKVNPQFMKFMIYDLDHNDIQDLQQEIMTKTKSQAIEVDTVLGAVENLRANDAFCIILSMDESNKKNVDTIVRLRAINPDNFIFVLTNEINQKIIELTKQSKRLYVLHKPITEAKIIGFLCEKLVQGNEIFHRNHPRFELREPVLLEKSDEKERSTGLTVNISNGGAYVELDDLISLKVTSPVKLTVNPGSPTRERVYLAEIVWIDNPTLPKNKLGIGLRFVNQMPGE